MVISGAAVIIEKIIMAAVIMEEDNFIWGCRKIAAQYKIWYETPRNLNHILYDSRILQQPHLCLLSNGTVALTIE